VLNITYLECEKKVPKQIESADNLSALENFLFAVY
jgi:hypothetical protein